MAEKVTPDDMRAIRARFGWSPAQLAKHLGCTQPTIWRMEHGVNPIRGPVEKLLRALRDEDAPPVGNDLDRIHDAAKWIATEKLTPVQRKDIADIVVDKFHLSAAQAQHAIAEAMLIWARAN